MTRAWLGLAALLLGCPGSSAPPETPPVATLGGRDITVEELRVAVLGLASTNQLPRDDAFAALARRTLDERILDEVLAAEATARGLRVADAEIDAEIAGQVGDPPNSEAVERATALYGSMAAWRAMVRRRLLVTAAQRAVREELAAGTSVTPEQVAGARPRFAERLIQPRRVRARQIFETDPSKARALHARLEAGEDFAALAEEAGGESGGDLGWMSTASAPTLLLQATQELQPGQHTPVLRSPLGYHIFELVAVTPAGVPVDEEADVLVERWLRDEAATSRVRTYLAERTEAMGLRIREDVLASLRCCEDGAPYLVPIEEK